MLQKFVYGHSMILRCNQCVINIQNPKEVTGRLRPELRQTMEAFSLNVSTRGLVSFDEECWLQAESFRLRLSIVSESLPELHMHRGAS